MASDSLTITLTGRPPVRIAWPAWPIIAVGSDSAGDGEVPAQNNRETTAWIRVRQHADGRAIVYGMYEHESHFRGEPNRTVRVGRLIGPGESIPDAIAAVGDELAEARAGADDLLARSAIADIVRDCIADLPAEELV